MCYFEGNCPKDARHLYVSISIYLRHSLDAICERQHASRFPTLYLMFLRPGKIEIPTRMQTPCQDCEFAQEAMLYMLSIGVRLVDAVAQMVYYYTTTVQKMGVRVTVSEVHRPYPNPLCV